MVAPISTTWSSPSQALHISTSTGAQASLYMRAKEALDQLAETINRGAYASMLKNDKGSIFEMIRRILV